LRSVPLRVAIVGLVAVVVLITPPTVRIDSSVWLPAAIVLTLLSIGLEFITVSLPKGGALSLATIPHVATILLLPHPVAAASVALAVLVEEMIHRVAVMKIIFNVSAYVVTISVASHLVGLIGNAWIAAGHTPRDVFTLAALFVVAGLTYYLVNGALVAFVVSAATQRRFLFLLRINARNTGLSELGAATVGMLFSALWIIEPAWTVVLAFPAAVIARSLQYIRQLESETRDAVKSIAEIVDHRDPNTYHHSERVASYALALAEELDVSDDLIEIVEQAGLVHDLGKVAVPDRVLLKPTPLTDDERAAMWTHTTVGAAILRKFRLFAPGADIVLHHHENFDGTGYPDGLAGEGIPLGARIVAVADAFDAMTSNRPYRRALTLEEALSRLRDGSGAQWDPVIVGNMIRLIIEERLDLPEHLRPRTTARRRRLQIAASVELSAVAADPGRTAIHEPAAQEAAL